MNISEPFIRRPIATSLLMSALALVGTRGFSAAAGRAAAAGRLSDHSSHRAVFRRQRRHDGGDGGDPARGAVRPDRRRDAIDLDQRARHERHHAAIRSQSQYRRRRAGRAGGDHGCRQDAAAKSDRAALLQESEPGRHADPDSGRPLRYVAADFGRRFRRERARPADFADQRRSAGQYRRPAEAVDPRSGRSGQAASARTDAGRRARRARRHHRRRRQRRGQRRAANLHDLDQRPVDPAGAIRRRHHRLSRRRADPRSRRRPCDYRPAGYHPEGAGAACRAASRQAFC